MSIFLCQKCKSFFNSYAELRVHSTSCKGKKVIPEFIQKPEATTKKEETEEETSVKTLVEPEVSTEIKDDIQEPEKEEDEVEIDRDAMVTELKAKGIDGRTLSKKSDEKIIELYEEEFGKE